MSRMFMLSSEEIDLITEKAVRAVLDEKIKPILLAAEAQVAVLERDLKSAHQMIWLLVMTAGGEVVVDETLALLCDPKAVLETRHDPLRCAIVVRARHAPKEPV